MKNANIWHDYYALTTIKHAYSIAFNSQNIGSIEKGIKHTNRLTNLKMNLTLKGEEEVLALPGNSPDLNPIETVLDIMKNNI